MYNIMNEGSKVFGCSSLTAVVEYITEIGVSEVRLQTNTRGQKEICIFLCNGEHVIIGFPCPTAAHHWIMTCIPGTVKKVISRSKGGCDYIYEA